MLHNARDYSLYSFGPVHCILDGCARRSLFPRFGLVGPIVAVAGDFQFELTDAYVLVRKDGFMMVHATLLVVQFDEQILNLKEFLVTSLVQLGNLLSALFCRDSAQLVGTLAWTCICVKEVGTGARRRSIKEGSGTGDIRRIETQDSGCRAENLALVSASGI